MRIAPARGRARARRPLPPVLRDWRAGAGLLALIAAIVVAVVASGGGSGDAPPATRAAALVPADALAFVHVSTDADRAAVERALALARRLGAEQALRDQLGGLLQGGGGTAADFDRDVRPWLGDEAALALTPGGGTTAGSLLLLSVTDEDAARAFLARTAGRARRSAYAGTALAAYGNGTVATFLDGFLIVGQQRSVRGAIDRAAGRGRALADDPAYRAATAGAPGDRVADAYATVDGVRRLLAPQRGLLGLAGALLDQRGLRAAALSLTAEGSGATVRIRAILDPRARRAAPAFTPTLTRRVPRDALAYAGFSGLERAAPLLLGLGGLGGAGGDTGALIAQAGRLLAGSGVSFARDVLPLFGREVAVTVVEAGGAPAVALLARTPDGERTRAALRRLEPAIAKLFAPQGGEPPRFSDVEAGGVEARGLAAGEGVELGYAVTGGTLIVSTSREALAQVVRPRGTIGDNPDFRAVIRDSQSDLTSIVFFDFSQLLSLFEPLGLTGDSGLAADLQRVRAVGLTSTSGEAQTTAELTFEIP